MGVFSQRICAASFKITCTSIRCRIQNGETLFKTKSLACFRLLKILKYVRIPVATQVLTNTCYEMSATFTDIKGVTPCTQKFVHNTRSEIEPMGQDRFSTLNMLPTLNVEKANRTITLDGFMWPFGGLRLNEPRVI